MPTATHLASIHTLESPSDFIESVNQACEQVGFKRLKEDDRGATTSYITGPEEGNTTIYFSFDFDEEFENHQGFYLNFGETLDPTTPAWRDEEQYRTYVDSVLELLCRVASATNAEYVALWDQRMEAPVPAGLPLLEQIDRLPLVGICADSLLEDVGGLPGLLDSDRWQQSRPPWRIGHFEEYHLVITHKDPWSQGGWTDFSYVDIQPGEQIVPEQTETDESDGFDLCDPFESLGPGAYGADVCIPKADIAAEFRNEDLHLVRVCVDEAGDLRRVDDDSFVRNVVRDGPADKGEFVGEMLADIPADASEDELMVSALLHKAIPPEFVQLDDPTGENVVTRVMDLDIETNKVDLLISLGRAAQHEEGMPTETIGSALANLAGIEDVEGIDQWIEDNLL